MDDEQKLEIVEELNELTEKELELDKQGDSAERDAIKVAVAKKIAILVDSLYFTRTI